MICLPANQFNRVKGLITDESDHFPLMHAVIDGVIEGMIYVDRAPDCTKALVRSRDNWVYILGESDNPGFDKDVLELFREQQGGQIIWFGIPERWKRRLAEYCACKIYDFPRNRYSFSEADFRCGQATGVPYEIKAIDERYVSRVSAFTDSIQNFWGNAQSFLSHSFGFVAMDNERVVGLAMIASVSNGEAEIDIETDPAYQSRGIAKALTRMLIERCLTAGLTPKWDCMISNIPSVRLAEHFGFHVTGTYEVSFITFGQSVKPEEGEALK